MSGMSRIIECVPNFSEGRDLDKIEKIVNPFRGKDGVKLLDYKRDQDHNRVVVTVVGEPQAVKNAMLEAMGIAIQLIDMTKHQGQHPRMGAIDVVPFIPIKNVSMTEAIELAKEVAKEASKLLSLQRKWQRKHQRSMIFRFSCMKRQRQIHRERIWQISARANSKEWLRR